MKKYSIEEIKKYLQSQDSFGDIFYNLSEESIDKANGYVDNTHVEDENKFEEGEEAHATEKGVKSTADYEDYLEKEGPDPAHDGIY